MSVKLDLIEVMDRADAGASDADADADAAAEIVAWRANCGTGTMAMFFLGAMPCGAVFRPVPIAAETLEGNPRGKAIPPTFGCNWNRTKDSPSDCRDCKTEEMQNAIAQHERSADETARMGERQRARTQQNHKQSDASPPTHII
jgi:hypothetical protein